LVTESWVFENIFGNIDGTSNDLGQLVWDLGDLVSDELAFGFSVYGVKNIVEGCQSWDYLFIFEFGNGGFEVGYQGNLRVHAVFHLEVFDFSVNGQTIEEIQNGLNVVSRLLLT